MLGVAWRSMGAAECMTLQEDGPATLTTSCRGLCRPSLSPTMRMHATSLARSQRNVLTFPKPPKLRSLHDAELVLTCGAYAGSSQWPHGLQPTEARYDKPATQPLTQGP